MLLFYWTQSILAELLQPPVKWNMNVLHMNASIL